MALTRVWIATIVAAMLACAYGQSDFCSTTNDANWLDRCRACNSNVNCLSCIDKVVSMYTSANLPASMALNIGDRCVTVAPTEREFRLPPGGVSGNCVEYLTRLQMLYGGSAVNFIDRCSRAACDTHAICIVCLGQSYISNQDLNAADRCITATAKNDIFQVSCVTTIVGADHRDLGNRDGFIDMCPSCTRPDDGLQTCSACLKIAYFHQDYALARDCNGISYRCTTMGCQQCLHNLGYTPQPSYPTRADIDACLKL